MNVSTTRSRTRLAVGDVDMVQAVRAVHLPQVDRVRLTDLAGFPNLRSIRLLDVRQQAEYVDLSITAGQPVEQVHIMATRFEPHLLTTSPRSGT